MAEVVVTTTVAAAEVVEVAVITVAATTTATVTAAALACKASKLPQMGEELFPRPSTVLKKDKPSH